MLVMQTKPKRDNAYFLERLRDEHPQIHADFLAGKFKNATEAFKVSGLIKTVTPLQTLERAWKDANQNERDSFKIMIGCQTRSGAHTAPPATSARVVAASPAATPTALPGAAMSRPRTGQANTVCGAVPAPERALASGRSRLSVAERDDIQEIKDRRGIQDGQIMREIGVKPHNASLGYALRRGDKGSLTDEFLARLRPWIAKNRRP